MSHLALPDFNDIFHDSPALIPEFSWGEVHMLATDSAAWRNAILINLNAAAPVCVIGSGATIDDIQEQQQVLPRSHALNLVEIKHRAKPKLSAFLHALEAATSAYPLVYIELNSLQPTLFSELMFQQRGLLELRSWAQEKRKLIVMVAQGDVNQSPLSQWVVAASSMANSLSLLYRAEHYWHWDIEHWYTDQDVVMRNLLVDEFDSGLPKLSLHQLNEQKYIDTLVQSDEVWYSPYAILPTETAPGQWQALKRLEDWQQEVPENSPGSILLGITVKDSIIELAQRVHSMRMFFGPNIRIFIREIAKPIRHEDENLLLHAGATMIIPFELKLGRIMVLIDNTAGWRFTRPILPTLSRILGDYERQRLQGYLAPQQFVKEVMKTSNYAGINGIHSALIRGEPMDGLDLIQIAAQFQSRREGDVVTIADGAIYIYLFACRESDVSGVLKFLIGLPSDSIFSRETRYCSTQLIQQALNELTQQIAHEPERDDSQAILEKSFSKHEGATETKASTSQVFRGPVRPKPAKWRDQ